MHPLLTASLTGLLLAVHGGQWDEGPDDDGGTTPILGYADGEPFCYAASRITDVLPMGSETDLSVIDMVYLSEPASPAEFETQELDCLRMCGEMDKCVSTSIFSATCTLYSDEFEGDSLVVKAGARYFVDITCEGGDTDSPDYGDGDDGDNGDGDYGDYGIDGDNGDNGDDNSDAIADMDDIEMDAMNLLGDFLGPLMAEPERADEAPHIAPSIDAAARFDRHDGHDHDWDDWEVEPEGDGHDHDHDHGHDADEEWLQEANDLEDLAKKLIGKIVPEQLTLATSAQESPFAPTPSTASADRFKPLFHVDGTVEVETDTDSVDAEVFIHRHYAHSHDVASGSSSRVTAAQECGFTYLSGIPPEVENEDAVPVHSYAFNDERTLQVLQENDFGTHAFLELIADIEHLCVRYCLNYVYKDGVECKSVIRVDNTCLFFDRAFAYYKPISSVYRITSMGNIQCPRGSRVSVEIAKRRFCSFEAMRGHPEGAHGKESLELIDLYDVVPEDRADECASYCWSFQDSRGRPLCVAAHLERSVCELFSLDYSETREGRGEGLYIFNIAACDPPIRRGRRLRR